MPDRAMPLSTSLRRMTSGRCRLKHAAPIASTSRSRSTFQTATRTGSVGTLAKVSRAAQLDFPERGKVAEIPLVRLKIKRAAAHPLAKRKINFRGCRRRAFQSGYLRTRWARLEPRRGHHPMKKQIRHSPALVGSFAIPNSDAEPLSLFPSDHSSKTAMEKIAAAFCIRLSR